MVIKKNSKKFAIPSVQLGVKKRRKGHQHVARWTGRPLYTNEDQRTDARSCLKLRSILLEIRKDKDKRKAYFLLLAFFQENPLEALGQRTLKEIALSISRGSMTMDESVDMLEVYELATKTLSRVEALCEKLKHVGFPPSKDGLRKARRLHLVIKHWTGSLQKEKKVYGIAA